MTAKVRIDHFICGATQNLKDLLAAYQEIGFAVCSWDQTVRHDPGLRTGFLHFSPKPTLDYIEFLTVENAEVFAAAQARGEDQWTDKLSAQGVGIRTSDANAVHAALMAQGADVEPVKSKRPEGAAEDTPYVWSFVELKKPAAGLGAFYVQYHRSRPSAEPEIVDGGNAIYALGGVLYDGNDAAAAALLLAKDFPEGTVKLKGKDISLGCHTVVVRPFADFAAAAGGHAAHPGRRRSRPLSKPDFKAVWRFIIQQRPAKDGGGAPW